MMTRVDEFKKVQCLISIIHAMTSHLKKTSAFSYAMTAYASTGNKRKIKPWTCVELDKFKILRIKIKIFSKEDYFL